MYVANVGSFVQIYCQFGCSIVPPHHHLLVVSDDPRSSCYFPVGLLDEFLGPVLRTQEPHSSLWNVVGVRKGKCVCLALFVQDGPLDGASINFAVEGATKAFHPFVGEDLSAWNHISLVVGNRS